MTRFQNVLTLLCILLLYGLVGHIDYEDAMMLSPAILPQEIRFVCREVTGAPLELQPQRPQTVVQPLLVGARTLAFAEHQNVSMRLRCIVDQ